MEELTEKEKAYLEVFDDLNRRLVILLNQPTLKVMDVGSDELNSTGWIMEVAEKIIWKSKRRFKIDKIESRKNYIIHEKAGFPFGKPEQ